MAADGPYPWLTERPIAHRGLHDRARGRVENSLAAARAAVRAGYAIECDAQASADGEIFVFHDETLERLTEASGRLAARAASEIAGLALRGAGETIPTLRALLAAIDGAVPLFIEIKSRFDGDPVLAFAVADIVASYRGPVAIESFDPAPIARLRARFEAPGAARAPLGIVAQSAYDTAEWGFLSAAQREEMTRLSHLPRTRPDFFSWSLADPPADISPPPRLPITAWTVRDAAQAEAARAFADQIVFEGFAP